MPIITLEDGSTGYVYPKPTTEYKSGACTKTGLVVQRFDWNGKPFDAIVISQRGRFKDSYDIARVLPDGSIGCLMQTTTLEAKDFVRAKPYDLRNRST